MNPSPPQEPPIGVQNQEASTITVAQYRSRATKVIRCVVLVPSRAITRENGITVPRTACVSKNSNSLYHLMYQKVEILDRLRKIR